MLIDKFIKDTIYTILAILLIAFLLIQPYNLVCRVQHSCQPITLKSLSLHKNGKQKMLINFSSQIDDDLKSFVEFRPEKLKFEVLNGKIITNNFIAQNLTNKNIIIASHFKVEPEEVKKYLERIECLCFQNQPLNAKKEVLMPVSFRINPEIEKDQSLKGLRAITISYQPYLVE